MRGSGILWTVLLSCLWIYWVYAWLVPLREEAGAGSRRVVEVTQLDRELLRELFPNAKKVHVSLDYPMRLQGGTTNSAGFFLAALDWALRLEGAFCFLFPPFLQPRHLDSAGRQNLPLLFGGPDPGYFDFVNHADHGPFVQDRPPLPALLALEHTSFTPPSSYPAHVNPSRRDSKDVVQFVLYCLSLNFFFFFFFFILLISLHPQFTPISVCRLLFF
ncbi:MAG: hypothetical protein Q8P67_21945 [archaeon]|nr:hypothetical protein [archaeon]